MSYLFSSESVSEGHPDKVADQISDAILDQFLAYDENARVAVETLVTTGQVVIAGEVHSEAYIDLQNVARTTINKIGYTKSEYQFDGNSCGIFNAIHEQSDDINRGVDNGTDINQGAGDQGMMFGYAINETENYMPVSLDLAHIIMHTLADIRKEGKAMTYLRPDSKSQVTIEYNDNGTHDPLHGRLYAPRAFHGPGFLRIQRLLHRLLLGRQNPHGNRTEQKREGFHGHSDFPHTARGHGQSAHRRARDGLSGQESGKSGNARPPAFRGRRHRRGTARDGNPVHVLVYRRTPADRPQDNRLGSTPRGIHAGDDDSEHR